MKNKHAMRRSDRALSSEDSWQFLDESLVGRLGLSDLDGSPYIVPLNHVLCDQEIFFHSATSGRKNTIISQNPQVCYEVDSFLGTIAGERACDFSAYFKSVIAFGTAYEVTDIKRKVYVLNCLSAKNAQAEQKYLPVTDEDASRVAVFGIKVRVITGKMRAPGRPQ